MEKQTRTTIDQMIPGAVAEASGRCSNPSCGMEISNSGAVLAYVFQRQVNQVDNLLALCPACADACRNQRIEPAAVQAWKILQIAVNGSAPARPLELRRGAIRNYGALRAYLPDEYRIFPGIGGRIYLNVSESPMMLSRALGIYEIEKTQTIRKLLQPGQVFADVGANKGDFSLLAAKIVGAHGAVLSFEPEPDNCRWLNKSIGLNDYDNITVYESALGGSSEEATLYLGEKSGWHSLIPAGGDGPGQDSMTVQRTPLDTVLESLGGKRIHMLKIDVEGAELEVLSGAEKTLANNPDLIILMDIHPHKGVRPAQVGDALHRYGFDVFDMKFPDRKVVHLPDSLKEIIARRRV